MSAEGKLRGRGTGSNPGSRFEKIEYVIDPSSVDEGARAGVPTEVLRDSTKGGIAYNQSPDVGFDASINPYRGCEHGCVYCYARPTHEYLGFSAGLDFESKVLVKEDLPEILREELSAKSWRPQPIAISGVTDAYQPLERSLRITRRCLEVLAEFKNPVMVVTKSSLVTRDIDVLSSMAEWGGALVTISVTTLDVELAGILEPRASRPAARLAALRELSDAGIPTASLVAPLIPAINDHEIPSILDAVSGSGATWANYILLRLPWGVDSIFSDWLALHYPDRAGKVIGRMRELRGGKMYDSTFGTRGWGEGPWAEELHDLFDIARRRAGLKAGGPPLAIEHYRRSPGQGTLF